MDRSRWRMIDDQDRCEWVNVFFSGTSSPGQSWTKGRKMAVVVVAVRVFGMQACLSSLTVSKQSTASPNSEIQEQGQSCMSGCFDMVNIPLPLNPKNMLLTFSRKTSRLWCLACKLQVGMHIIGSVIQYLKWQRMPSSAACASCAMSAADTSSHSAVDMLTSIPLQSLDC